MDKIYEIMRDAIQKYVDCKYDDCREVRSDPRIDARLLCAFPMNALVLQRKLQEGSACHSIVTGSNCEQEELLILFAKGKRTSLDVISKSALDAAKQEGIITD